MRKSGWLPSQGVCRGSSTALTGKRGNGGGTAHVRVANRDRQCIRRVFAVENGPRQKGLHHHLDLVLVAMSRAGHGFFHQVRRIFGNAQARLRGNQKRDAARLAQLQRRAGVAVDEGVLHGGFLRGVLRHHQRQPVMQLAQPQRQLRLGVGLDRAGGDEHQLVARALDDAPARVAQARVDADDSHGRFLHGPC